MSPGFALLRAVCIDENCASDVFPTMISPEGVGMISLLVTVDSAGCASFFLILITRKQNNE